MATNFRLTVILATIYLVTSYAGCKKRTDCKQNIYSFEAFFKLYPNKDSVQLNDTIWLELTTPTHLNDLSTNQTIDYSGAVNLGTNISFDKLLGDHDVQFCAACFELKVVTGSFVPDNLLPERNKDYLFVEGNGQYQFNLAIIPKTRGLFCFGVGNASSVYRQSDKCTKASFDLTFKNTNQHLYLYEQSRPGYTPSEYERRHVYCFTVY